jgi:ATP-dependent Clp protease protease subunit
MTYPYVCPPGRSEPTRPPMPPVIPMVYVPDDPPDADTALLQRRIVLLSGPLDDERANLFSASLLRLDLTSGEPITVMVNSAGGPLSALGALLDTMTTAEAPMTTVVLGQAHGTAAVFAALATGDRQVAGHATVSLRLEPEAASRGSAEDLETRARWRRDVERSLAESLANVTRLTADEIAGEFERGQARTARETVGAGLADSLRATTRET